VVVAQKQVARSYYSCALTAERKAPRWTEMTKIFISHALVRLVRRTRPRGGTGFPRATAACANGNLPAAMRCIVHQRLRHLATRTIILPLTLASTFRRHEWGLGCWSLFKHMMQYIHPRKGDYYRTSFQ
jgi:hypothetical protein